MVLLRVALLDYFAARLKIVPFLLEKGSNWRCGKQAFTYAPAYRLCRPAEYWTKPRDRTG